MTQNNTSGISLLVLGIGAIARDLVHFAARVPVYKITICEPGAEQIDWPAGVQTLSCVYAEQPFALAANTHAVVARGHEGDAQSITALMANQAERVYLIASARRAHTIIDDIEGHGEPTAKLSAPAGLELGGNQPADIALSILAEIQWRVHGGSRKPLCELRDERVRHSVTGQRHDGCPGKLA